MAPVPPAAAAEVRHREAGEAAVTVCTLATRFSLEVEAQLAEVEAQLAEVEGQLAVAVVEAQLAVMLVRLVVVLAWLPEVKAQLAMMLA